MNSAIATPLVRTQHTSTTIDQTLPVVVKRDEIPAITHVVIDGEDRYIGEVRDFRGNASLRHFIPNEGRASLSWVRLGAGETHQAHTHPTASMVIICEGSGELIGDTQQPVAAGDLVIIPSNTMHGFIGPGSAGLRGISLQFEGLGLYENADKPRMQSGTKHKFKPLVDAQAGNVERFGRNRPVELVKNDATRDTSN
jgi:quercetin dioxygenase-like cupin family protein